MLKSAVFLEADLLTLCPSCVWVTLFSNMLDLSMCVILAL